MKSGGRGRELGLRAVRLALPALLAAVASLGLACGRDTARAQTGDAALAAAASGAPRVALIGIDGADWRVIRPMLERGELPHLGRLVTEGASGVLRSYPPTMSPQVWNTIVTGKHYSEHGVDWFVVRLDAPRERADLETDEPMIPVTSAARKVPALWDILGQAGDRVGAIGFWATWPATPVRGFMVSDRFSYSRVNMLGGADQYLDYQTYPPALAGELRDLVMAPGDVTPEDRARFLGAPVEGGNWRAKHDIIAELDITYAQTETYRRVGLEMLDRGQPDFFAIYFQGVDVVCHYFWEFYRPQAAGHTVPPELIDRFGGVVEAFYRYQDAILGEILDRLGDDTVVIVVSDHGFEDLPYPKRAEETVSGWHRIEGILAMAGPGVRPGAVLDDADVYDITPTILALRRQPLALDMGGHALEEAFLPGALPPSGHVPVYAEMPEPPPVDALTTPMDEDVLRRLRALGYISN